MNQQNTTDIEKPNIIYIMLDEWGFLSLSGGRVGLCRERFLIIWGTSQM